uniref:Uncharacterized protein n=1 Tax=Anopheles maculatus TaxID=74869 RepID=A0A182T241_9DIPT
MADPGSADELAIELGTLVWHGVAKMDERCYESLLWKINAPIRAEEMIRQLASILPCVVHPRNVCVRMMAGVRRKTSIETIVTSIVAEETFHFQAKPSLHPGALKAIRTRYNLVKQFYSLAKIHKHLTIMEQIDPANKEHAYSCVHRSRLVIAEVFTDMTKLDLHRSVQQFMRIETIGSNRNEYAHKLIVYKPQIDDEKEEYLLQYLLERIRTARLLLQLVLAVICVEVRRYFYRSLHQCHTLASLRALLIYTGESDCLQEFENQWYAEVANCNNTVASARLDLQGDMVKFLCLAKPLIEKLDAIRNAFPYDSVRKMCFAIEDLRTIRKLLSWKLKEHSPSVMLEIGDIWLPRPAMDSKKLRQ